MERGPKTRARHPSNTGFRKPTALHIINGNPSHIKGLHNRNEPTPPIEIPPAPKHIKGEALAEWDRITPKLLALKLLSQLDRAALAVYCSAWGRYVEAEKQLESISLVTESANGYPCVSPWVKVANDAAAVMSKSIGEFGLSPNARVKLAVPSVPALTKEKVAPNAAQETATGNATETATQATGTSSADAPAEPFAF